MGYFNFVRKCLCILVLSVTLTLTESKTTIEVTSDQPTVIGSNITFTATLKNPEQSSYDIVFQEMIWPNDRNFRGTLTKANKYQSNWTLEYRDDKKHYRPGRFSMTTEVSYQYFFITVNVDTVVTYFTLTQNFTGSLEIVKQPGMRPRDPTYVSTLNETQLILDLHDPSNYISEASNLTWSWYNETAFVANTSIPSLKYNFTKEGQHYISVELSAEYNTTNPKDNVTSVVKRGFFDANITAKVPIVNFTILGEAWFPNVRLLNLSVLCDGSAPYSYCFKIYSGSYNVTGNETCEPPYTTTNDCEFPIVWFFGDPGFYSLLIIIENDVTRVVNRTAINAYKVTKKQPLSIIIVPLSCTLLALVMIIFGIAYFWENRARFSVEVADFDFGQADELPYMTFVERLKDAITSTGATRQRLYNAPDDEPILSSRRPSQFT